MKAFEQLNYAANLQLYECGTASSPRYGHSREPTQLTGKPLMREERDMNLLKTKSCSCVMAVLAPLFLATVVFASPQTEIIDPANLPLDQMAQPAPAPPRIIDKSIVGWQQAGTDVNGPRISDELGANWVVLNENHGLSGQVVGATGPVTVHLLRGGFVVSSVISDELGNFEFETATEGVYSIVGRDNESFFAFGFIAVENTGNGVSSPLRISTMPVYGVDNFRLIAKLISQDAPSVSFAPYGEYDIGETENDPPQYYGIEGLKNNPVLATPSTTIDYQPITLLADGRFVGRIHQVDNRTGRPIEVTNTSIKVIQNGELVAETQTDVYGIFEFAGLVPGYYGVVAVGADGLGAAGVELVAGGDTLVPPATETNNTNYKGISRVAAWSALAGSGGFDCSLCDPEATGWINAFVQEEAYNQSMNEPRNGLADQPMPFDNFGNDPFGGGGGFGGPGGFGFGSLGDFLIPAAIGIAIADAASSESDFSGGIILPTSPFDP